MMDDLPNPVSQFDLLDDAALNRIATVLVRGAWTLAALAAIPFAVALAAAYL